MYIPAAFREDDQERLTAFIRANSFGLLISSNAGQLVASHLPLLLDTPPGKTATLRGHMARANPQWRGFGDGSEVLAIFQGSNAYISPSWYTTGPAVPTWNYVAVHAYGTPRLIDDRGELRRVLEATVSTYEDGFERPWRLGDQPEEYIAGMMEAIVGFEIAVSRLEGKRKLSQNRPDADRPGVIAGLRQRGSPLDLDVAELMATELQPRAQAM